MNTKLIVAAVAVAVSIACVAGAIVIMNNGDDEDHQYDASKGWYSWNPTVVQTKSAYFTISPLITAGTELMYEGVYGEKIDTSGYSVSDIPSDFLAYDSLVVERGEDTVTINSRVRDGAQSSGAVVIPTAIDKCPDSLLCTSGYAATLHALLTMKYGETTATAMLWDYVYGLDKSAFPGGSADVKALYGFDIPGDVVSLNTTYYYIRDLERYIDYFDEATAGGRTAVLLSAGSLSNPYSEMGPFYDVINSKKGAASACFFFSNGLGDVLAGIEAVGAIYDLDEQASEFIQNLRLEFYAMSREASHGDAKKAYLESNSGTGCGTGTITNDVMTQILGMDNIDREPQWTKLSEEYIIDQMPDVIIFYDSNPKSMDELMRVGVSLSGSRTAG